MARVAINTGASANDGTGDNLKTAGGILNNNFLELYTYLGAGSTTVLSAPLWSSTNVGINTLRNVGIGTTNPTSALTVTGNGNFTGIVTATSFSGSGSGLTNIPSSQLIGPLPAIDGSSLIGIVGSGSGVIIKDDGSPVGTAGTIDFGANLNVSFGSGIATITTTGGGSSQFVTTSAGIHTLSNVGIGTTNPTSKLTVYGDGNFTGVVTASHFNSTSDENLKYDIKKIENSIHLLNQINGVKFKWKLNNKSSIGVIAQEVEKVFPELINNGEVKSINYSGLIGVLIEAVKTQSIQINILQTEIKKLKK